MWRLRPTKLPHRLICFIAATNQLFKQNCNLSPCSVLGSFCMCGLVCKTTSRTSRLLREVHACVLLMCVSCVLCPVMMRDLTAQVTSSLLRFPGVTIDALGEDEITLDSVLHGKFTVGKHPFSRPQKKVSLRPCPRGRKYSPIRTINRILTTVQKHLHPNQHKVMLP